MELVLLSANFVPPQPRRRIRAHVPRRGRLDRGIERQKVRLICNLVDDSYDLVDIFGHSSNILHQPRRRADDVANLPIAS